MLRIWNEHENNKWNWREILKTWPVAFSYMKFVLNIVCLSRNAKCRLDCLDVICHRTKNDFDMLNALAREKLGGIVLKHKEKS